MRGNFHQIKFSYTIFTLVDAVFYAGLGSSNCVSVYYKKRFLPDDEHYCSSDFVNSYMVQF